MPFLPSDTPAPAPLNPWTSMWLKPRQTIDYLLATKPSRGVITLAMLGGVMQGINNAVERDIGDSAQWQSILLMTLVINALIGVVALFIGGWLMSVTGKWIGGKANAATMRTVGAWAQVPVVWMIPLWLVLIALTGRALFVSDSSADISLPVAIAMILVGGATIIAGVWTFVLYVIATAQAQGFSIWKAIGNLLLSFMIAFVVIVSAVLIGTALVTNI